MRVAAKAAESSHTCSAAAEASQSHTADTDVSAGSQHQPATYVAGSRGTSPRENVDPELVVATLVTQMRYLTQNHLHHSRARPGVIPRLRIVRRGAVVHWVN